jgi:hypothetical protein
LSSGLWDNSINVVIILDNDHRFKEDPEYGKMLKRMWNGDLTSEDRKKLTPVLLDTKVLNFRPLLKVKISHLSNAKDISIVYFTHRLNNL